MNPRDSERATAFVARDHAQGVGHRLQFAAGAGTNIRRMPGALTVPVSTTTKRRGDSPDTRLPETPAPDDSDARGGTLTAEASSHRNETPVVERRDENPFAHGRAQLTFGLILT